MILIIIFKNNNPNSLIFINNKNKLLAPTSDPTISLNKEVFLLRITATALSKIKSNRKFKINNKSKYIFIGYHLIVMITNIHSKTMSNIKKKPNN